MNPYLIVVDIQPFYDEWHRDIVSNLTEHINENNYKNIFYFFNGSDLGIDDTHQEISYYLLENGLEEEKLNSIIFIEKSYGFFRTWMDYGVNEDIIVYTIKYMIENNIYDTRDIGVDILESIFKKFGEDFDERLINDPMGLPTFDLNKFKSIRSCDICGGGRNECLLEIELLLEALDIKYNRIEYLIYG